MIYSQVTVAALILQLRRVITGFLEAPAVLERLGILPEIEDDDWTRKTDTIEEDQITRVCFNDSEKNFTGEIKPMGQPGDPGIFWVGYPTQPNLLGRVPKGENPGSPRV